MTETLSPAGRAPSSTGRSASCSALDDRAGTGDRPMTAVTDSEHVAPDARSSQLIDGRGAGRRPHRSGPTSISRCAPASSSPCSARTASASRPCSRRCSGCCRSRAGQVAVLGAPAGPAQRRHRLPAAAAHLRSGHPDPRRRRGPARAGRRPVGRAAAGLLRRAGSERPRAAGGRGHRPGRRDGLRAPADRAVLRRRAAAAADRPGAGPPAGAAGAGRAAGQPRRDQPGRR